MHPYICITTSRVLSQDIESFVETETFYKANFFVLDIEDKMLPHKISLQQCYSPFHDNNDIINDDITLADVQVEVEEEVLPSTASLEQCYSSYYNNDFYNDDNFINDIRNIEADNVCEELYNSTRSTHFNNPVDNGALVISIFLLMMRMNINMIFLLITETADPFL